MSQGIAKTDIVAIVPVYNRRDISIRGVRTLIESAEAAEVAIKVIVVDDGTDGTGETCARMFEASCISVRGSGNLFWGGGIRLGASLAADFEPRYLLWYNDDTCLLPHGIADLMKASAMDPRAIVVGPLIANKTGVLTYGGLRKRGVLPLRLDRVGLTGRPEDLATFNGNCVLIPCNVDKILAGVDPSLPHGLGDWDYGLRARRAGIRMIQASAPVGYADHNPVDGTYGDLTLPVTTRLRSLWHTKGLPALPYLRYCMRHAGALGPLYFAAPTIWVIRTHFTKKILQKRRAAQ